MSDQTICAQQALKMEIQQKPVKVALALALTCLIAATLPASAQIPAPDPRHYDNADYQFSLDLPEGFPACLSEHTNHGVDILLDRPARCTDSNDGVTYIDVSANYNVAWEAKTPYELARIQCRYDRLLRIVWLNHVILGGRKAAGCRRYFKDGRISVTILTLRWTEAWAARWIEVSADLETTVERYDSDMRTFKAVLKTVWIHPDGPHR